MPLADRCCSRALCQAQIIARIASMFELRRINQGCSIRPMVATRMIGSRCDDGIGRVTQRWSEGCLCGRRVWRGTISFGLVTIPVRLYVATESKNIPSHQIHVTDGGRVQYKRVCSIDGAEVPYEEIGRGYESATGELVMLSEVDLAMLPAKTSRSIEVISFLPVGAVDPIYLDRSYYVEPEPQGARAYRLLRDALHKLGRVAVAKVTLREREIVAALRVHGDVLILATMLVAG